MSWERKEKGKMYFESVLFVIFCIFSLCSLQMFIQQTLISLICPVGEFDHKTLYSINNLKVNVPQHEMMFSEVFCLILTAT